MFSRVSKEIADCTTNHKNNFKFINKQLSVIWEIDGPTDSPYEGKNLQIHVIYPSDYPFIPPIVKFLTDIFHPNVKDKRLYILELMSHWIPNMNIENLLLVIQLTLKEPQMIDPRYMNEDALILYETISGSKGKEEEIDIDDTE